MMCTINASGSLDDTPSSLANGRDICAINSLENSKYGLSHTTHWRPGIHALGDFRQTEPLKALFSPDPYHAHSQEINIPVSTDCNAHLDVGFCTYVAEQPFSKTGFDINIASTFPAADRMVAIDVLGTVVVGFVAIIGAKAYMLDLALVSFAVTLALARAA